MSQQQHKAVNIIRYYPLLIVLFCLVLAAPVYAEEEKWYEPFFIEAAGHYNFSPGFFSKLIKPGIGFRGALGYEYNRFRFAVESGYNRITGVDPQVFEIGFTPLVFKFGYALPLFSIVGLQADLNTGVAFSKTLRYQTAIDHAMDNVQEIRENSFITGGRLYATVTPLRFLRIYAGGGIDLILEKEGPLSLPLVEVGIHFKPFALPIKSPGQREKSAASRREELASEINTTIEEQHISGVTVETTNEGIMIRLSDIQFRADSAELPDSEKLKIQEIANILRNISGIKILVEGHTARAGTVENQIELSRQRAQAVASYIISLGAVDASNVTVIGHGANRPIADNATAKGMSENRRVEITILEN
jgi:outer membrane protein OmpA-like peptidoglycan-associated protein